MSQSSIESPQGKSPESLEQKLEIVVAPDSPPPDSPCLFLAGRSGRGRLFPMKGSEVIIGRAAEADVCLDVPAVSNQHTRLYLEAGDWWVEDLGSTNGTFLNGVKLAGPTRLGPGYSVEVGGQRLLFLAAGLAHEQTLFLGGNATTEQLRSSHIVPVSGSFTPMVAGAAEEDPIASTFRLLRRIRAYVMHYIWLATSLVCVGAAGGILHARFVPPEGSASFDIALREEASINPVEEPRAPGAGRAFFTSAPSVFLSLPLIRKTLQDLGRENDDAAVLSVQKRLVLEHLEPLDGDAWRGEYSARTSADAATLLAQHLDNFLQTEIEKALQVFRAQTEFLSTQLAEAQHAKQEAEGRFVAFREQHPDIIPGTRTFPNKESFLGGGVDPTRVRTTESQLLSARQRLTELDPLAGKRFADAAAAERRVSEIRARLEAAQSHGLGERHPEVRKLAQELALAEAQLAAAKQTRSAPAEIRATPEFQRAADEVRRLELEARAVGDAADLAKKITRRAKPEPVEQRSRPQLEAEYLEAATSLESARQLHATLTKKFRAAELQLQLERATAEAHYDVITPPTAAVTSSTRVLLLRGVIGAALGFMLTLLIAGFLEVRRLAEYYHE